jgi:hypothetical protein
MTDARAGGGGRATGSGVRRALARDPEEVLDLGQICFFEFAQFAMPWRVVGRFREDHEQVVASRLPVVSLLGF